MLPLANAKGKPGRREPRAAIHEDQSLRQMPTWRGSQWTGEAKWGIQTRSGKALDQISFGAQIESHSFV